MRVDWDRRAAEDAYYFTAFGRRGQTETEFFDTAGEVLLWLRGESRHLGPHRARAARFLEIGCGPGRLMRPLAAECGEIHGVDVSEGMLRLAPHHLNSVPNAFLHRNSGDSLADFESAGFDFVYSYAVFQHILRRRSFSGISAKPPGYSMTGACSPVS
jgi:2-polyprenyl-3-methyl-5-hydroxy-6-metoxy-1,4-benzoquinol methylase